MAEAATAAARAPGGVDELSVPNAVRRMTYACVCSATRGATLILIAAATSYDILDREHELTQ
eukprot:scaffold1053_cov107-Isochrysis_galbana.AAC.2